MLCRNILGYYKEKYSIFIVFMFIRFYNCIKSIQLGLRDVEREEKQQLLRLLLQEKGDKDLCCAPLLPTVTLLLHIHPSSPASPVPPTIPPSRSGAIIISPSNRRGRGQKSDLLAVVHVAIALALL